MDEQKINHFKEKLQSELKLLEEELSHVAKKNVTNHVDWESKPADFDTDSADDSEVADKMEELEENSALVTELENKYNDVKHALKKIEEGKYGICEVGGEQIEEDRLEAIPSAKTCKAHME